MHHDYNRNKQPQLNYLIHYKSCWNETTKWAVLQSRRFLLRLSLNTDNEGSDEYMHIHVDEISFEYFNVECPLQNITDYPVPKIRIESARALLVARGKKI